MKRLALFLFLSSALAAQTKLPLPDAPVVLVIPDAPAFDRALGGGFRTAMTGELSADDPVAAAWARTRVGTKLAAEWGKLSKDAAIDWNGLMSLKPRALGLALLGAGDLEAVLAIDTPLAELPLALPAGEAKTHRGAAYHLVAKGAGDEKTSSRRLGLAWAVHTAGSGRVLLLATSERALVLALDRALAGGGTAALLPGLASLRLDLQALRKDLYFRREFLFEEDAKGDVLLAALRVEDGRLVEARETTLAAPPAARAATWGADGRTAAAGWETDGTRLFSALRRGLLEPVPSPPDRPLPDRHALPDANAASDRYLVDIGTPVALAGRGGEGELPGWREALASASKDGFGWEIGSDGARRLVMEATAELEARLATLAEETEARRAGRAARDGDGLVVGARLPALAWRRTGPWLWIAARASDLASVPEPRRATDVARWGHLSIAAVKAEGRAWERAEGPFSPETTRPFSDRVLGLLGWAPQVSAIDVERRIEGSRLLETVRFSPAPAK